MKLAQRLMTTVPLIGAGLIFSSIPQLSADELANYSSLDAVTVYATRSERSVFDVPGVTTIIDVDRAGNSLSGDIEDLLQFTPGVEVAGGARRNVQTITVRGFDDEAVITLLDGRRQNFESGHDGRFYIDPNLLKSVEIVKGASSAVYGGGAIGGVVAFETKEAADLLEPGQTMGAMASMGYRSANNEFVPSLSAYAQTGAWDILGTVSYRHSGDIEQGDDNELLTKDRFGTALVNLGYRLDEYSTFKLNTKASINDGEEPNSADGAITTSNVIVEKEIEDYQVGVKYAYSNPDNDLFAPKLHLYYNNTEVEEENISGANLGRVRKRQMETVGFTADNQTRYTQGSHSTHTFSYGFEYVFNEQTTSDSTGAVFGGAPNAEGTQYGVYLQDEFEVKTALGDFLIIPAARYDNFDSEDDSGNSQDKDAISPKFSATYKPTENIAFFGSWAQAFRAPNLTETYAAGQHFPAFVAPVPPFTILCPGPPFPGSCPTNNFVPNPNLKPETVTTFEVGAKFRSAGLLSANDQFSLSGSWFTSKGKDFITQEIDYGAGTTTNVNVDNAILKGFEAQAMYQYSPIQINLGASWVHARNDDTGDYLLNYTPLTFVADINYTFEEYNTIIGWRSRFAAKNDKVASDDVPTDGYDVHDVYLRWSPEMTGHESLTVDLGVQNVFDAAYQKKLASLYAEGRSFVAKVNYKW